MELEVAGVAEVVEFVLSVVAGISVLRVVSAAATRQLTRWSASLQPFPLPQMDLSLNLSPQLGIWPSKEVILHLQLSKVGFGFLEFLL